MCEDIEVKWKGQRVYAFDLLTGVEVVFLHPDVSECQDDTKLSMK